ncbi:MAG: FKBP-type peptidyl-prolyl cis-trans isomerase [Sandaracinaceae bacterium]
MPRVRLIAIFAPSLVIGLSVLGLCASASAHPNNRAAPAAPPDVAAPPSTATRTPSGLAYRRLAGSGGGVHPSPEARVRVHYTGWQTDGTMFDSSVTRGRPADFPLRGVIDGFSEMIQLMSVGDRVRVWIPESLAYRGRPGAPAGMLVFEIELIEILS